MTEIILSLENIKEMTGILNGVLEGHPITLFVFSDHQDITTLSPLKAAQISELAEIHLEINNKRFISRTAKTERWNKFTPRGIFTGIGDRIALHENKIICMHTAAPPIVSHKMTVVELADAPSAPFRRETNGIPGKAPGFSW